MFYVIFACGVGFIYSFYVFMDDTQVEFFTKTSYFYITPHYFVFSTKTSIESSIGLMVYII